MLKRIRLQPYVGELPAEWELRAVLRAEGPAEPRPDPVYTTVLYSRGAEERDTDVLALVLAGPLRLVLWDDRVWTSPDWLVAVAGVAGAVGFSRFALPLMRRAYPTLLAHKLVNVQPMTQPASLIFYLRYKYSRVKNSVGGDDDPSTTHHGG